jgi:hypothetical protein
MVLSCLVEPLVSPLTGQDTSGRRRTGLTGTRLLSTALACASAIVLAGAAGEAKAAELEQARIAEKCDFEARNAHKKPDPIPYQKLLQTIFLKSEDRGLDLLGALESPCFEQTAIDVHRLRRKRDLVPREGPNLGLGQRIDRLYGGTASTFLRFAAAVHRSGASPSL